MNLPLTYSDAHHARAAMGWLELGNAFESSAELDKVSPENQRHAHVLVVRCMLYAKMEDWDSCRRTAAVLTELAPERPTGWTYLALGNLWAEGGGYEPARQILLSAVARFPRLLIFPYNLACYACQTGNLADARRWLQRAFSLDESKELKLRALEDPDLSELWQSVPES